jgi:hypothetical protein
MTGAKSRVAGRTVAKQNLRELTLMRKFTRCTDVLRSRLRARC